MKKYFLALLVYLFCAQTISAQMPTPTLSPDRKWTHLQIQLCSESDAKCSIPATDPQASRRFILNVANADEQGNDLPVEEKLEPDADTYLFECIATSIGSVCTSGNTGIDAQLYNEDRSKLLNQLLSADTYPPVACGKGYSFEGIFSSKDGSKLNQPVRSNTDGELDPFAEWQSCSPVVLKSFLALNYADPNRVKNQAGDLGGQQQTQIGFDKPLPTATLKTNRTKVTRIVERRSREGDPYGRVFDSQTLEPVPGAAVLLTKERSDGSFTKVNPYDPNDVIGGTIINPYVTKDNGFFNFIVPDGTYRLELPEGANKGIRIASDTSQLNPGYLQMYSDIYPLYTGQNIIQKGKIQHRDIPVITESRTIQPPKLTAYSLDMDKTNGSVYINGQVNIPMLDIKLYSVRLDEKTNKTVRGKILADTAADKNGKFDMTFKTSLLSPGETYGEMELEKPSLMGAASDAQRTASVSLSPVLNYLRGYAIDGSGNTMPYAYVDIYLSLSDKPYFRTKADKQGFFEVSSENLPPFNYTLRFTSTTGKSVDATTMQLALQSTDTNLYAYKRVAQTNMIKTINNAKDPAGRMITQEKPPKQNNSLVIAGILVLAVSGILGITMIVLKKRKNTA